MDRDRDRRYGGRDRDGDRDRDRNRDYYDGGSSFHANRAIGGESYRPSGPSRPRSRSPSRNNTYRRRSRSPREERDRFRDRERARSRERGRREDYRDRERDRERERDGSRERRRSPPRPRFSPRREENNYRPVRSPIRDARLGRSPLRDRTPLSAKRSRETSPAERRRARSPPLKRERLTSPASRYRSPSPRRSYSPRRDRQREGDNNYRPRSRSPRRDPAPDRHARRSPSPHKVSAPQSGASSRRSSPPVHPSRIRQVPEGRLHPSEQSDHISPPRERERDKIASIVAPPTGPRNGPRVPPSGPAGNRSFTLSAASPPSGPANAATPPGSTVFSAPSRPRGGLGAMRGGYSGYSRDFPASRRASDYQAAPRSSYAASPPSGPRAAGGGPPTGPAAYRTASAVSQTQTAPVQRPQRFINDLPTVIPGGRLRAAKPQANTEKVKKLDQEAERLRRQIADVEVDKRAKLGEWERLQGEAESARLGTELAAERLRALEMQDFT